MSTQALKLKLLKLAPLWAFLAYGGWAAWVNYTPSPDRYWLAGLIQGSYAFFTTLLLRLSVLAIYKKFQHSNKAALYTYVTGLILLITIPALIHTLFGTKAILYAVLPGAIIGSVYLGLMVYYETRDGQN